jgi:multidrug resistance efflux pump
LRIARAELEGLRAELQRTEVEQRLEFDAAAADHVAELRRFVRDLEAAKVELLSVRAEQVTDQVEAGGLEVELGRHRALAEQELVSEAVLARVETGLAVARARIAEREPVLAELRGREATADKRLSRFRAAHGELTGLSDLIIAPVRWSIEAQRARIEELELARTRLTLVAPAAGVVASILRRPGEVAAAGAPVVQIVDARPRELVAHFPEAAMLDVHPGHAVELVRVADRSRHTSRVLRTGTQVSLVPARAHGTMDVVAYGLPVVIACPDGVQARVGEAFTILPAGRNH